jgi:hypothetical protein
MLWNDDIVRENICMESIKYIYFKSILWYCHTGYHPQEELVRFGYIIPVMKVEFF